MDECRGSSKKTTEKVKKMDWFHDEFQIEESIKKKKLFYKYFLLLFLIPMALTMNSCATLFNGTKQSVYVRSMTSDSKIYIDGNLEGMDAVTKKLNAINPIALL